MKPKNKDIEDLLDEKCSICNSDYYIIEGGSNQSVAFGTKNTKFDIDNLICPTCGDKQKRYKRAKK